VSNNQDNWLQESIRILKGKGVITRDKDVADKTGYSKVSISGMLSGTVNISTKFRTKFNEVFGEYLLNAVDEPEVKYVSEGEHYKELYMLSKQHIDALNRKAQLQEEIIELLENKRGGSHS